MPILENNFLVVDFSSIKGGYTQLRLKEGYYAKGHAQGADANISGGRSNLTRSNELKVSTSDYFLFDFEGTEYSTTSFSWQITATTKNSVDLYGNADTLGGISVNVIEVKADNIGLSIASDRTLNTITILYYFTLDGKGLIKKVSTMLNNLPYDDALIQSGRVFNFAGVSGMSPMTALDNFGFKKTRLGFDYRIQSDLTGDWTIDGGLTATIGKPNAYPNLLPDFNSSEWQSPGTVISASSMNLSAGDDVWLSVMNAFPDERDHWFNFDISNQTGQLNVEYSLVRNPINTTANAELLSIGSNGAFSMEFAKGFGYAWLYVRLNQVSGSCRISNPIVTYENQTVAFKAPDGAYLANSQMEGCVRIVSSNPNGKQMTYSFSSNVKIADGKGIGINIRSLDNTDIQTGAFKVAFQKPDNSWVDGAVQNLFVDYNEKFNPDNAGNASQLHQWEDGIFGISVPSGMDEIKGFRIEFTTTNAIDWLFDDTFVLNWQSADNGMGSDDRRNFGPGVVGLRARDWHLRGAHGIVYPQPVAINADPVFLSPGNKVPISFGDVSSITEIFELSPTFGGFQILDSRVEDRGNELRIDVAGFSDLHSVTSVSNGITGDSYRIKSVNDNTVTVDVANKIHNQSDVLVIYYLRKDVFAGTNWSFSTMNDGRKAITWVNNIFTQAVRNDAARKNILYASYTVSERTDSQVGMIVAANNYDVGTQRLLRGDITEGSPLISNYSNLVFTDSENSTAETTFIYYPTVGYSTGDTLYSLVQSVQDTLQDYTVKSRKEPLSPVPKSYNLIPHVAFGGEQIAAQPIGFIQDAAQQLASANTSNAIISAGSLAYLRDRDTSSWWWWGGSLRDNSIDYLKTTRNMLRGNSTETEVSNAISSHRYWFEVTTFAYEHNKRYRSHASTDYKGVEKFKRVWYYQNPDGLYTARVHAWDDFKASYYDPVTIGGGSDVDSFDDGTDISTSADYVFQYHYTLVIPAFWSIVTSKSDWSLEEDTIYDLMKNRLDYLCQSYDCEGVIISEMIHYREGFSTNDFTLFNNWAVANGYGTQVDWPRFGEDNYADPDDSLIWQWKRYQVKKFLTEMATVVHGHNKMLGVNVLVQNVFGIVNPNNSVWSPYTKAYNPDFDSWHVDTLDFSMDRYGTNYKELLKENIVDFFYVWLYHQYSAFGSRTITEFMDKFDQYKDRMFLTIGLFPMADPPQDCEIISLLKTALGAGWNVAYAGYPPMMFQDSRFEKIFPAIKDYVSNVSYDSTNSLIKVNPRNVRDVPFYARF